MMRIDAAPFLWWWWPFFRVIGLAAHGGRALVTATWRRSDSERARSTIISAVFHSTKHAEIGTEKERNKIMRKSPSVSFVTIFFTDSSIDPCLLLSLMHRWNVFQFRFAKWSRHTETLTHPPNPKTLGYRKMLVSSMRVLSPLQE